MENPAIQNLKAALTRLREQQKQCEANMDEMIAENNQDNIVSELMVVYTSHGSKE